MVVINKLNILNTSLIRPVIKHGLEYRLSYTNYKDTFERSNTCNISFNGKSNAIKPKNRILELKKSILRLEYSAIHPSKIIYGDGALIGKELQAGKTIEDILDNNSFRYFQPKELDKIVNGVTIKQHLLNYAKAQKKIVKLKQQISKIESTIASKPNNGWTYDNERYYQASYVSNKMYNSPLYSRKFRYQSLSLPVKNMVYNNLQEGRKSKFLVVGLGTNCEEVYDYAFYSLQAFKNTDRKLADAIDIEMVDYRPKHEFNRDYLDPVLIEHSTDTRSTLYLPSWLSSSLLTHHTYNSYTYPIDILEFVADTTEDKSKFHHSTPIEKFAANYQGEGFDFLSINNVLQYPGINPEDYYDNRPEKFKFVNPFKLPQVKYPQRYVEYREFLENILKMVKPGGFISCKLEANDQKKILNDQLALIDFFNNEFVEVQDGLYKRINNEKS